MSAGADEQKAEPPAPPHQPVVSEQQQLAAAAAQPHEPLSGAAAVALAAAAQVIAASVLRARPAEEAPTAPPPAKRVKPDEPVASLPRENTRAVYDTLRREFGTVFCPVWNARTEDTPALVTLRRQYALQCIDEMVVGSISLSFQKAPDKRIRDGWQAFVDLHHQCRTGARTGPDADTLWCRLADVTWTLDRLLGGWM